jgi:exodeoxyribonuclease VII large subunit
MAEAVDLSVSEFVAVFNQTMEYAFSSIFIHGELANFRVRKQAWVYFDLKDEEASVSCFGSVYALPGPLEDGMMLKVRGTPRLHPRWGFSFNYNAISPAGIGSIKRQQELLAAKLEQEGLFALERKRQLPYPPKRVGLITSVQSAAFADFKRILDNRWSGIEVDVYNVSVQGENALGEITEALDYFSSLSVLPDVLVIIRGGGSPEDLAVFNSEQVTRAVAASRVPTLVAIGHESDISLAELAADRRASTPSNAVEMLVPDKQSTKSQLEARRSLLSEYLRHKIDSARAYNSQIGSLLTLALKHKFEREKQYIDDRTKLIGVLSPREILKRGYALVKTKGHVSYGRDLKKGSIVTIEFAKIAFGAEITKRLKEENKSWQIK